MFFERNRWFVVATTLFCAVVVTSCSDDDAGPDEEVGEVANPLAPAAPNPVSPNGPGTSTTPTYVWDSVAGATSYLLWVNDAATPGGKIKDLVVTPADAGCAAGPPAQCQTTPATALSLGAGKWWIRARNADGTSPYSDGNAPLTPTVADGKLFDVGTATQKPGATTITAPAGSITSTTPTYTWNAIVGAGAASSYKLYVEQPPTVFKFQQIFTAAAAGCGSGEATCSVTPATALNQGPVKFYIQGINSLGDGLWNPKSLGIAPLGPVLNNPTGTITTATGKPTYQWTASTGAVSYTLEVDVGPPPFVPTSTTYIPLTAAQANCVAPDTTCEFTPTAPVLPNGASRFWVQAIGPGGYNRWSTAKNFTVNLDECTANTDNCDPAATCTDTPTGFTCGCPAGQIGNGTTCSCDLSGTFAVLDELDITWGEVRVPPPDGILVFNSGSATTKSWSIRQQTVQNGTLQVSTIPCGATSPDLCSPLFGQAFSQILPNTIWQGPNMPVGVSSMPLTDPDPGEAFVTPLTAMLGGIKFTPPEAALGPWPSFASTDFEDHDSDGNDGMTQQMKTGTSTVCGQNYANLPDPIDPFTQPRIDRIYVASRLLSSYSGTITSCDRIEGNVAGPASGKPQVNGHVAGCRKVGGAACSAAVATNLDTNGQTVSQQITAARFTMIRDTTPGLNCDQVRLKNYAPPPP